MCFLKNKISLVFVSLVVLLPLLQLLFFYLVAMKTGLPGRRGGPQDAFRHTYACAVVAKYISPRVVELITELSEEKSDSPYDAMDIHNNTIGIQIGLSSKNIYKTVESSVANGGVNSEKDGQTTWLPQDLWTNGL